MTAIDDAVTTIQQLQSELARLTAFLIAKQNGSINEISIDTTKIDNPITNEKQAIRSLLTLLGTQLNAI